MCKLNYTDGIYTYTYIYIYIYIYGGVEFPLHGGYHAGLQYHSKLCYYVHFQTIPLGIVWTPFIPTNYGLNSTTTVFL